MSRKNDKTLPIPVKRALLKLGQDIQDARKRRRITVAVMAERASISPITLSKIEKGDSGVAMGNYATVLFILGLLEPLGKLADLSNDVIGMQLAEEDLPKRIRRKKPKPE